jgi:phosphonate transport system substrate-binding protein
VPARLFQAADHAGVGRAFAARQIELAFRSPAAHAGVWMDMQGGIEPILVTQEADGSTSCIAVMYGRADSFITDIAGLRGRAMAWADPNSALGQLMPRAEPRAAGINPEPGRHFARTGFAGDHDQAVIAVPRKQFDAGVTWVSGVGDAAQGFSRGNLRSMVRKGMPDMKELRIIWRSLPIQNGPMALRTDLPAAFRQDMIDFHLVLPRAHPEIHRAVERGRAVGCCPPGTRTTPCSCTCAGPRRRPGAPAGHAARFACVTFLQYLRHHPVAEHPLGRCHHFRRDRHVHPPSSAGRRRAHARRRPGPARLPGRRPPPLGCAGAANPHRPAGRRE